MCNRARFSGEPETIFERFGAEWLTEKLMDNRFDPKELRPFGRAYVVRNEGDRRGLDVMEWDVLAGQAKQAGHKRTCAPSISPNGARSSAPPPTGV